MDHSTDSTDSTANTTSANGHTLADARARAEALGNILSYRIGQINDGLSDPDAFHERRLAAIAEDLERDVREVRREAVSPEEITFVGGGANDDLIADLEERRAKAERNNGVVGARGGLEHLDHLLNGFEAGRVYFLAAMPGAGKTTLALQMAAHVAQVGDPSLFISLEHDTKDIRRKLACRLGDVSYAMSLKGDVAMDKWAAAVGRLSLLGGRLGVVAPSIEAPSIASLVEGVSARCGRPPALIVLDYLQRWVELTARGGDDAEIRHRVNKFAAELKSVAKEYGCAILAISSQNRAGYNGGGMSSLKESGGLEYSADVVMVLSRPDADGAKGQEPTDKDPLRIKLDIVKNKQGMTGTVNDLLFRRDLCRIEEEDR